MTMKSASKFQSVSDNERPLLQALKEMGGSATKKELYEFPWRPENRQRFARNGTAWAYDRIQHDLFYSKERGYIAMERVEGKVYRYHLIQAVIQ